MANKLSLKFIYNPKRSRDDKVISTQTMGYRKRLFSLVKLSIEMALPSFMFCLVLKRSVPFH